MRFKELQEPDFVPATGPGIFWRPSNFLRVFKQIFVAKMKKTSVIMSQKLLLRLCICEQKK